jgi:hypothetical protein
MCIRAQKRVECNCRVYSEQPGHRGLAHGGGCPGRGADALLPEALVRRQGTAAIWAVLRSSLALCGWIGHLGRRPPSASPSGRSGAAYRALQAINELDPVEFACTCLLRAVQLLRAIDE